MIVCELISYLSYFYEVLIVCFIDEAKTVCQICSIGKPSVGARDWSRRKHEVHTCIFPVALILGHCCGGRYFPIEPGPKDPVSWCNYFGHLLASISIL